MTKSEKIPNRLINETSPYLIQHAYNPVNWFAWGDEAFEKAKSEDKPVFLSVGYSTCHWCHVMAHESFEDNDIAEILNDSFISIKVDKEERPDIDSIYMTVCQTFTGSGGWPLTVIMTPDMQPFFVGTYFPKISRYGSIGFIELLQSIDKQWKNNKEELIKSGAEATKILSGQELNKRAAAPDEKIISQSVSAFKRTFDKTYGGFGNAPKFPTPHNLLFLLKHYETSGDKDALDMVLKTLEQMYKGGIFDHIDGGFSRYSTDKYWLIPHFEKMLYDNALLNVAYLEAYDITKDGLYKNVAVKIIRYVEAVLTDKEGGFYCAEDADSDGVEGKYYAFLPSDIIQVLGKADGEFFNEYFDITQSGNFESANIPNLLKNKAPDPRIEKFLPIVSQFRKKRTSLHKDDKILTSWNSLMIAAYTKAYKILGDIQYLNAAINADKFISKNLMQDNNLFTSCRAGKHTGNGFLDDYSFYIFAQIFLYDATLDSAYLNKAALLANMTINNFYDAENGGFYMTPNNAAPLIFRPKESYDGAIPSGNSVMTYNLVRLSFLTGDTKLSDILQRQIQYMTSQAADYPSNYSFFTLSLLTLRFDTTKIVCSLVNDGGSDLAGIKNNLPKNVNIIISENGSKDYPLINNKTTYYVCEDNKCLPPSNSL